jgi:hypothetical protein
MPRGNMHFLLLVDDLRR